MASIKLPLTGICGDRRVVRAWAIVPDDSFTRSLLRKRLALSQPGYARRNGTKGEKHYLHREIFERYHGKIPDGKMVDHIDRNKLHNLPENLRAVNDCESVVNRSKNKNNTTGYVGVTKSNNSSKRPWQARVTIDRVYKVIGYFETAEEAARAVNKVYEEQHPHVPVPNLV